MVIYNQREGDRFPKERRKKMRYFVNIVTGALCADFIAPMYTAYYKEIGEAEFKKLYLEYYGFEYVPRW
jgi:hypothetical protein